MIELVFATNNLHKLSEVSSIVGNKILLKSLKEIGCNEDIPEDKATILENALQKARFVYDKYGFNCFADDTGLIVDSLDGAPGVYSARYAGEDCIPEKNIEKLLNELRDKTDRNAYFMTVVALIIDGKEYFFEGKIFGTILEEKRGNSGFGYDPIFLPEGKNESFAEMGDDLKNKISHRALAIKALSEFLNA